MEKSLKAGKFLKSHLIKDYTDRFKDSSYLFVTDFGGLTNKELEDLRKRLRPVAAGYLIVKNSICTLALKQLKITGILDMITDACALSYGKGDPVTASKLLIDIAKTNKNLKIKGGYINGEVVLADAVRELAALPSREILLARLVSCLNASVSGFISVCSGVVSKFICVLNEISKKKK